MRSEVARGELGVLIMEAKRVVVALTKMWRTALFVFVSCMA
jgi:hypothetical protein